MEEQMRAICAGTANRHDVVQNSLDQYRDVFVKTSQGMAVIKAVSVFDWELVLA